MAYSSSCVGLIAYIQERTAPVLSEGAPRREAL